mgnify:CR=1 FL=1
MGFRVYNVPLSVDFVILQEDVRLFDCEVHLVAIVCPVGKVQLTPEIMHQGNIQMAVQYTLTNYK